MSVDSLTVCGILTTLAIAGCLIMDQQPGFNMLMIVFSILGLIAVWSNNKPVPGSKVEVEKKEQ
jgi:hypothetical protein